MESTPASARTSATGGRHAPATGEHRRNFFAKAVAILAGGFVTLFPFAAGLAVLFDPLRRKAGGENWITVATLGALPQDGAPHRFPILKDQADAWTLHEDQPIGAVYLRHLGKDKLQAFTAICPHAGCFVDYKAKPEGGEYQCPCHTSAFTIDGKKSYGPSPRDLDAIEARIVEKNGVQVIEVDFKNYVCGKHDRIAQK